MKKQWICLLSLLMLAGCASGSTKGEKKIQMGQAYYASHGDGDICLVSVAMQDDVILGVTLDEITYLSNDEFKGLPNTQTDTSFGQQTDASKNLASKVQNDEAYSGMMKANGATHGIKENYQAICDFAVGKGIEDLRQAITGKSDDEIIDAVSGCTLKSTKGYLEAIIEACKNAH